MPEPLLLSLPPVRLDWPFRLDATAGIYGGRVIVPVDIAAFLRRAFRGNANESYFMRRGAIGVRVLNNGCNPDS